MATSTKLLIPNLWTGCNNNDIINNKILAQEQKTRIMKELYKIAEKELRESENARKQCVEQLRNWIKQNVDIDNCLVDDNFLLRFLRVKKFSIPMAEQTLLKYLNFRKKFKQIMYDMDYTDPKLKELMSKGYIFVSPFRDSYGRRVIIYNTNNFDIQKFTGTDLGRAHAIVYETLLDDEENQILGVNHVGDVGGVTPAFITLFTITEFSYLIRWGEQSFPMRHKEINILNLPKPLKYVYDFAKSNMSEKLKDRFKIHDSLEQLYQRVDRRCLPAEFGGDMPASEMVQMWLEELCAKRKRLLSFNDMHLLSDRGIIKRRNTPSTDSTGDGSLPGSFRKLDLD